MMAPIPSIPWFTHSYPTHYNKENTGPVYWVGGIDGYDRTCPDWPKATLYYRLVL